MKMVTRLGFVMGLAVLLFASAASAQSNASMVVADCNSVPSWMFTVGTPAMEIQTASGQKCMYPGPATPYHFISTASTNSQSVKGSAGTLFALTLTGLNTTVGYVRIYDSAAAPTCSSATGAVFTFPVIGSATALGGLAVPIPSQGIAFANGIGFCITGGSADNDNTSGPAGVIANGAYK